MAVQVTLTWRRIVAALLLVVLVALAGYGLFDLVRPQKSLASGIDRSRFQAVVLSSGVVYFGHLRVKNDDFYELRDAYFIQEVRKAGSAQPERTVKPLTDEVHGPENSMLIPRDHLVSVENLRADSPIAKAASGQGQ